MQLQVFRVSENHTLRETHQDTTRQSKTEQDTTRHSKTQDTVTDTGTDTDADTDTDAATGRDEAQTHTQTQTRTRTQTQAQTQTQPQTQTRTQTQVQTQTPAPKPDKLRDSGRCKLQIEKFAIILPAGRCRIPAHTRATKTNKAPVDRHWGRRQGLPAVGEHEGRHMQVFVIVEGGAGVREGGREERMEM